jgi:hypothetical protein
MCAWRAPNRRLPEICQKARSVVVRTHGVTAELGELPRSPRPCGPRLTTGPGSPRRAEWPSPGWCGDSGHPWRCPDAGRHRCWAGPARGVAVDTASLASVRYGGAKSGDWPPGAIPAGCRRAMADRKYRGRFPRGEPVARRSPSVGSMLRQLAASSRARRPCRTPGLLILRNGGAAGGVPQRTAPPADSSHDHTTAVSEEA